MSRHRDPTANDETELPASAARRKRSHSGIGARGEGIKVEGDQAFDPHRFQTFEVTPAFRQRILEAPLPLLEVRDQLMRQAGPVQQRRARPDDTTQPVLPSAARRPKLPSGNLELPIPLTRPTRTRGAAIKWLIVASSAVLGLVLALVHLYTRAPASVHHAEQQSVSAAGVPLLPAESKGEYRGSAPAPTTAEAAQAAPASAPNAGSARDANAAAAASKKTRAQKKLWLPAE